MKTIFKHTLLSLTLLAGAFTAQAQVKIGTSPTTIAPTSNLEVEATNNKKVIVDKAVGTVNIENLPSGFVTDSVVVSDPITGLLRRVDKNKLLQFLNLSGTAQMTAGTGQAFTPGVPDLVDFTTKVVDTEGSVDLVNNRLVIKKAGLYSIQAEANMNIGSWGINLFVNNIQTYNTSSTFSNYSEKNTTRMFAAGDVLEMKITVCQGCNQGTSPPFTLQSATLTIVKYY